MQKRGQNWPSDFENDRFQGLKMDPVIYQLDYSWSQVNTGDKLNVTSETVPTNGKFRDEVENP